MLMGGGGVRLGGGVIVLHGEGLGTKSMIPLVNCCSFARLQLVFVCCGGCGVGVGTGV